MIFVLLTGIGFARRSLGEMLLPPDPTTTVGHVVPFDGFVDADGREFAALLPQAERERDARPWIVSPMYTRCPGTCSALTAEVRRALDQSGLAPTDYRIVSFSFDPHETADGLREFRDRMQLPSSWLTLRARTPAALERTLKSLDFRTITRGDGNFDHPNLVAVLAPDQRLAGYLFGIAFSPTELARAVRRARDGVSAADAWRPYAFLFAALGFLGSAWVLALLLAQRRKKTARRSAAARELSAWTPGSGP